MLSLHSYKKCLSTTQLCTSVVKKNIYIELHLISISVLLYTIQAACNVRNSIANLVTPAIPIAKIFIESLTLETIKSFHFFLKKHLLKWR